PGGPGPGPGNVGVTGIILLTTYLVLFTLLLIYALIKVWPVPTASREQPASAIANSAPAAKNAVPAGAVSDAAARPPAAALGAPIQEPATVELFGSQFKLWDEQRLLLMVLLAGALG